MVFSLAGSVSAANITVTPGTNTIKHAINTASDGDTLNLVSGIYNDHDIVLTKNLTIMGPKTTGEPTAVIDASKLGRFLTVNAGVNVNLKYLLIQNGNTASSIDSPNGGGIHNYGTLTLKYCTLKNNSAIKGEGGAISNSGTCTCTYSTINQNNAETGGGISNYGTCTLTNSKLTNNAAITGGGLFSTAISNIHFNQIVGNTASGGVDNGAAIFAFEYPAMDASLNWWGSNDCPNDKISWGSVNIDPWLILTIKTNPSTINGADKSIISADILHDSNGIYHDPITHIPDGLLVNFKTSLGTITTNSVKMVNGSAVTKLNGGVVSGIANISVVFDHQKMQTAVNIIVPPKLSRIDPLNNALNVPVNKIIKITFSEPIKNGNKNITLTNSKGIKIPIKTSINGRVLTINHNLSLANGKYLLTLHTGSITDIAGNSLRVCVSRFTVDSISPTVKKITPITTLKDHKNSLIKITFSEKIKPGTLNLKLISYSGKKIKFTQTIHGNTLIIKSLTLLKKGTKYSVVLHTGSIKDLAGNNVALYRSNFITA